MDHENFVNREFDSQQQMRADAIQNGLSGNYQVDYSSAGIFVACLLAFILLVLAIGKKKKAN